MLLDSDGLSSFVTREHVGEGLLALHVAQYCTLKYTILGSE